MDRVRRLATDLLERHKALFSADFSKNKEALKKITVVRSKQLRNKVAGQITLMIKRNIEETGGKMVSEQVESEGNKTPSQ